MPGKKGEEIKKCSHYFFFLRYPLGSPVRERGEGRDHKKVFFSIYIQPPLPQQQKKKRKKREKKK